MHSASSYGYELLFRSGAENFFPDAILDMKIEDVLQEIPIRSETRDAGNRTICEEFTMSLCDGNRKEFERAAVGVGISAGAVSDLYVRSMEWGAAVLAGEEVRDSAPV